MEPEGLLPCSQEQSLVSIPSQINPVHSMPNFGGEQLGHIICTQKIWVQFLTLCPSDCTDYGSAYSHQFRQINNGLVSK
jgi:hypothetical protein